MIHADTDECQSGELNNCDQANGICINIPGSFNCSCSEGYTGDGVNCTGTVLMQVLPASP